MVAASFVVSGEPVVSDGWLVDALSPVAGSVPRFFSVTDAPDVPDTVVGSGVSESGLARVLGIVRDLFPFPHEERLSYLAEHGYSLGDVQRTSAFVESWMRGGVRREVRRFAAVADELGTKFQPAFLEWLMGSPAKDLELGILELEVREPSLALAYAFCELSDDLRAARNLALVRQHVPDWESVGDLPEDIQGCRLDEASFVVDAESWPTY